MNLLSGRHGETVHRVPIYYYWRHNISTCIHERAILLAMIGAENFNFPEVINEP